MKIKFLDQNEILFDNGMKITCDYAQECCEYNYADFEQIDMQAWDYEFEEDLIFEVCEYGFRFGDHTQRMFFVPCYSEQNGYYGTAMWIYFNGKLQIDVDGELIDG